MRDDVRGREVAPHLEPAPVVHLVRKHAPVDAAGPRPKAVVPGRLVRPRAIVLVKAIEHRANRLLERRLARFVVAVEEVEAGLQLAVEARKTTEARQLDAR